MAAISTNQNEIMTVYVPLGFDWYSFATVSKVLTDKNNFAQEKLENQQFGPIYLRAGFIMIHQLKETTFTSVQVLNNVFKMYVALDVSQRAMGSIIASDRYNGESIPKDMNRP